MKIWAWVSPKLTLDQGWLWPWETQKHWGNLSQWNSSWWQKYDAKRALAFKLRRYSLGSGSESMCCLNIQILALVSSGGFQGWGTEHTACPVTSKPVLCREPSIWATRQLQGRTPYGINWGAFQPPGVGKEKVLVSFKQPYGLYSDPKDERKRLGLEGSETYEPHEVLFC